MNQNNLSGSIPESLGDIATLKVLDLSENSLTGDIPEDISSLSALGTLQTEWDLAAFPLKSTQSTRSHKKWFVQLFCLSTLNADHFRAAEVGRKFTTAWTSARFNLFSAITIVGAVRCRLR